MKLTVKGIRRNNLAIDELTLPLHKTILLTGPSGSGKSTLARDILFKEGQRLYLEGLGLGDSPLDMDSDEKPVESISGIPPTLYLDQVPERIQSNVSVGTFIRLTSLLRLFFTLNGEPRCVHCGIKIPVLSSAAIRKKITGLPAGTKIRITTPIPKEIRTRNRQKTQSKPELLQWILKQGFVRLSDHGKDILVEDALNVPDAVDLSSIRIVIDRLVVKDGIGPRLDEALKTVEALGSRVICFETDGQLLFALDNTCPVCLTTYPQLTPRLFSRRSEIGQCPICKGKGCDSCGASGLGPFTLAVEVLDRNFPAIQRENVKQLHSIFNERFNGRHCQNPLVVAIVSRLEAMIAIGLDYLDLDRPLSKVSRGEFQRLRLIKTVHRGLSGTLVILDEPTTGLHPKDYDYLKELTNDLRRIGNSVILIEHDSKIFDLADWITVLGPGSGSDGGRVVYNGPGNAPLKQGQPDHEPPHYVPMRPWGTLTVDDRVKIPLGGLTVITGISGSGKTRYVSGPLNKALSAYGLSVKHVDQAPIRGNRWAMVVTFINAFTPIRAIFSRTREARSLGLSAGAFSLSKKGGRCEVCKGTGRIVLDLSYLGSMESTCHGCGGSRYKESVLTCKFKGKNISDVLAFTIKDAVAFFSRIPDIRRSLELLIASSLHYLTLGQEISSLSGGEAMRLRLATAFPKGTDALTGFKNKALILDEPSAGLSQEDMADLLNQLRCLQKRGITIVVVDHEEVFKEAANLIIELGPGAGPEGGRIIKTEYRCRTHAV